MTRTARRRFPILLAAIAALALPVAVLAVVLHFGAKPVSAQTTPEVTIAADRQTIIAELDHMDFTLTRTVATEELDVNVVLTQDRDFLEGSALLQTVTFGAGQDTAELRMLAWDEFAGHEVTQNGSITATVRDGTGYVAGTPATATVGVLVADPAVTVWHEQPEYRFAEDAAHGDTVVAIVARTAAGVPVPAASIHIAFSTKGTGQQGQATSNVDFDGLSVGVEIAPSDFEPDGSVFTARKEVRLTVIDDLEIEGDEYIQLKLEKDPGLSPVVAFQASSEGAACDPCHARVIIVDNDQLRIQGICDRTARVRDRILVRLKYVHGFKGGCAEVNETHLAKVRFLGLRRNPSTESGFTLSLRRQDFEGLLNLEELDLADTGLRSLPAEVFGGLTSLQTLNLNKNRLRSLPAGVFAGLRSLATLRLQQNPSLRSLPYDEFEALPALTELRVDRQGRRKLQVAGGAGDAVLEVAAGGTATYQVRLMAASDSTTANPVSIGVSSSNTAVATASPATLRFTGENWFRSQTVTVDVRSSASGTAALSHEASGTTMDSQSQAQSNYDFEDYPLPTVTVRVPEPRSVRFVSPPASPTGLSAQASQGAVTLTWDDPGDSTITGYVILRRVRGVDAAGEFHTLVADTDTGTAATSYTDATVQAEKPYTYSIKAINAAGTSERSRGVDIGTPAALTTTPVERKQEQQEETQAPAERSVERRGQTSPRLEAQAPAKPTGLMAAAAFNGVILVWVDPGDNSITGYVVLRRNRDTDAGGQFTTLVADTGTAATSYIDDTVQPEAPYSYRIRAINAAGTSERSRAVDIDTLAALTTTPVERKQEQREETQASAKPPAKPTRLIVAAAFNGALLGWDDPGDDSISGYVILRRNRDTDAEGEFHILVANTGTAATTYTDATVQAETPYSYRIRAINAAGTSERSRAVDIDTLAAPSLDAGG